MNLILSACATRAQFGGRQMERRTFIGGLNAAAGIVGVGYLGASPISPGNERYEDAQWRLQNARAFFPKGEIVRAGDLLYQLGIVSQLALTACVIAEGWTDDDCRRRIGLDVGKALFFAKAAGLQFDSDPFTRLVPQLSPYGQWRSPATGARINVGTIDVRAATSGVSQLLMAVRSHLVGAEGKAAGR
ncbi:hypothetical protein [Sphingopyxis sp. DBS4]|uniref:hypothetical protein n=1 Tax=Sphingopyxis sp. DBS4 TaxID=2968500 RepID=UPI00214D0AC2|nr:hypothetical protein [Sphingopyxis sp. DBS4]